MKEGSTSAFLLCLIGGILAIIIATLAFVSYITLLSDQYNFQLTEEKITQDTGKLTYLLTPKPSKTFLILAVTLFLIQIIFGLILFISSFSLRKNNSIKTGSVIALIASIVSLNPLGIIGAAIGITKTPRKNKIIPQQMPNLLQQTTPKKTTPLLKTNPGEKKKQPPQKNSSKKTKNTTLPLQKKLKKQ